MKEKREKILIPLTILLALKIKKKKKEPCIFSLDYDLQIISQPYISHFFGEDIFPYSQINIQQVAH